MSDNVATEGPARVGPRARRPSDEARMNVPELKSLAVALAASAAGLVVVRNLILPLVLGLAGRRR